MVDDGREASNPPCSSGCQPGVRLLIYRPNEMLRIASGPSNTSLSKGWRNAPGLEHKPQRRHRFDPLKQPARQQNRCCRQPADPAARTLPGCRNSFPWDSYAPRFRPDREAQSTIFSHGTGRVRTTRFGLQLPRKLSGAALVTHSGFHGISFRLDY